MTVRIWMGALVAVLGMGCSAPETGAPEILYGLEECAHCRMIISEERYAAAIVDASGEVQKYDDLGCILRSNRKVAANETVWVHDMETGDWIDGRGAWFIHDPSRMTPMGSGVVGFARQAQAAARGEEVLDWNGLLAAGGSLIERNEENG